MNATTNTAPATSPEEPTQAEMDAFNNFDPLTDIPSPVQMIGDVKINAVPTLASFSPDHQQMIRQRMGNSNSAASTEAAIHGFLLDQKRNLMIKGGAGEGATQTQRTMLEQARRVDDLRSEADRIDAALNDVIRHDTVTDTDGTVRAVPVYSKQGDARRGLETRKAEIGYEMVLIAGVQGDKELKAANRADALAARAARNQLAEAAEATAMAHDIVRKNRIQKMAESKARLLGEHHVSAVDYR